MSVHNVDRGKLDPTTTCMIVVEKCVRGEKARELKYRVANTSGQLKTLYGRYDLEYRKDATAAGMGMGHVLTEWKDLPVMAIRSAVRSTSITGGQGMFKCLCQGACRDNKCTCFKHERLCNSRCHPRNRNCYNWCDE